MQTLSFKEILFLQIFACKGHGYLVNYGVKFLTLLSRAMKKNEEYLWAKA